VSTVDRARENLSTANTRFGNTYRAWDQTPTAATHKAHLDAIDDLVVAELDLEDALRKDGDI
jgi:hypothetical protein